jgi:hypothetical protein
MELEVYREGIAALLGVEDGAAGAGILATYINIWKKHCVTAELVHEMDHA